MHDCILKHVMHFFGKMHTLLYILSNNQNISKWSNQQSIVDNTVHIKYLLIHIFVTKIK